MSTFVVVRCRCCGASICGLAIRGLIGLFGCSIEYIYHQAKHVSKSLPVDLHLLRTYVCCQSTKTRHSLSLGCWVVFVCPGRRQKQIVFSPFESTSMIRRSLSYAIYHPPFACMRVLFPYSPSTKGGPQNPSSTSLAGACVYIWRRTKPEISFILNGLQG